MSDGWIRLHRKIFENELYFSEPFTKAQAWIDLILLANFKPSLIWIRGIEVKLERGQMAYSELTLSKRWCWSREKVRRFLKYLKTRQQIDQQTSQVTSIITLLNYGHYQLNETTDETTDETTKKQQKNNRRDTNNKDKKDKNEKKKKEDPPVSPKGESEPLVLYGDKFLSMTEKQWQQILSKYGVPLVQQELPMADEWIALSDTPNGRKYRKPGYNHYLFFNNTWLRTKSLNGGVKADGKKRNIDDLEIGKSCFSELLDL